VRGTIGLTRRLGVAVIYTAAFVVTDVIFRTRTDGSGWLTWASTNLANLPDHPVGAMAASAFFAQGGLLDWALLAVIGLGVVNWSLGNWRTALLVATAHVLGTLISEGLLAYLIATGRAPDTDRYLVDVGPSYVVVCALAAGIAYGRGWHRLLAAAGFAVLSPDLFGGLPDLEVAPVGHLCSVMTGLALGWPLWRSARRRAAALPAAALPVAALPVDLGEVGAQIPRVDPHYS
jgi:Rhomboid-like protein